MLGPVRTFARLGPRRQALFLEALLLVGFATVATRVLPFQWTRRLYGRARRRRDPATDEVVRARPPVDPAVRDVAWALYVIGRRFFRDTGCLARAIAGRIMLRRRGYAPTLYIGAQRVPGADTKLHAWLLERGTAVTGVREAESYTTLAVFDAD